MQRLNRLGLGIVKYCREFEGEHSTYLEPIFGKAIKDRETGGKQKKLAISGRESVPYVDRSPLVDYRR
ncbi:hypothetical protein KPH14_009710 [Odynerus spinipes]|uniref:Uncharacterized protein n=1 Tax=Odynerus spinipes TaxID=1348599 RepID=A0AAD9RQ31_9HYME|nr:hypothetical protein KPH14_009710 [Odynerus spinipes]